MPLEAEAEIDDLLKRIVGHGEKHPLGSKHMDVFKDVDLLIFFQYAAQNRTNFFQTPIEQVINDSSARK